MCDGGGRSDLMLEVKLKVFLDFEKVAKSNRKGGARSRMRVGERARWESAFRVY